MKPLNSQDLEAGSDFDLISSLESVVKNHKLIEASMIDSKAAELRVKQSEGGLSTTDVTANYGHENIIKYGRGIIRN